MNATQPPRVCEECGADRWFARDASRTRENLDTKIRDVEDLARSNGLLTYRLKEAEAKNARSQSQMQRKIIKQARVIRRLEVRLKGQAPYKGAKPGETAPGAEYDAAQSLSGEQPGLVT